MEDEKDEKIDEIDEKDENMIDEKDEKDEKKPLPKIPEDWTEIPLQDYFAKGYRPLIVQRGSNKLIYLRGGREGEDFVPLGSHTDERWKLLLEMYPRKLPSQLPPIKSRIAELKKEGITDRKELAHALYSEGYPTTEIMHARLPIKGLKGRTAARSGKLDDDSTQAIIASGTRGTGYMQELKDMVRRQVSLSSEFASACTNAGIQVVLSALRRTELKPEELRRVFTDKDNLKDVVGKATETALKALEYYDSDRITEVESERDEARAYACLLEAQIDDIKRRLDPKFRLEKMIYNLVLLSGTARVDPNALTS